MKKGPTRLTFTGQMGRPNLKKRERKQKGRTKEPEIGDCRNQNIKTCFGHSPVFSYLIRINKRTRGGQHEEGKAHPIMFLHTRQIGRTI